MALAPIIAAALNVGLPARTKMLTVNGLDVLKQPGSSPVYGTELSSVHVSDAGPGQISSMTFTVLDPTGTLTVAAYAPVSFWDITADRPIFTGFVDTFNVDRLGVGRSITVQCVGIESVLDWMIVPSLSVAASGTLGGTVIQSLVAQATGVGVPLNVATDPSTCTRAAPILNSAITSTAFAFAGVTLRQAIQTVCDAMTAESVRNAGAGTAQSFNATVDMYGGLRVWGDWFIDLATPGGWGDATGFTLSTAGANKPSGTESTTTAAEFQSVYVNGGNAAGSGLFGFGDGLGPVAYISDPNSLTADYAKGLAYNYRSRHGGTVQGTVTAEELFTVATGGGTYAAGSFLSLTDPQAGITAATNFTITRIEKDYLPTTEWWTISFGAMQRLGSTELRRLTRTTLN